MELELEEYNHGSDHSGADATAPGAREQSAKKDEASTVDDQPHRTTLQQPPQENPSRSSGNQTEASPLLHPHEQSQRSRPCYKNNHITLGLLLTMGFGIVVVVATLSVSIPLYLLLAADETKGTVFLSEGELTLVNQEFDPFNNASVTFRKAVTPENHTVDYYRAKCNAVKPVQTTFHDIHPARNASQNSSILSVTIDGEDVHYFVSGSHLNLNVVVIAHGNVSTPQPTLSIFSTYSSFSDYYYNHLPPDPAASYEVATSLESSPQPTHIDFPVPKTAFYYMVLTIPALSAIDYFEYNVTGTRLYYDYRNYTRRCTIEGTNASTNASTSCTMLTGNILGADSNICVLVYARWLQLEEEKFKSLYLHYIASENVINDVVIWRIIFAGESAFMYIVSYVALCIVLCSVQHHRKVKG